MNFKFCNKRISGVLAVVPANERSFVEEMKNYNFPEARSLKLKEVMGYDTHRMVQPNVCVSDLGVFALKNLFNRGLLKPEDIDALILVTQTPDYFMPPTSNVIQGKLNLKQDLLCLDISQGCAGYVIGLIQAFMLLEQDSVRKVVLLNADVLSRRTSPKDRNIYPLIGDAASVTVVQRDPQESVIHASFKMDGVRHESLIIPAGGFKLPSTPDTAILVDVGDNNMRGQDHLRMDGSAVFNFVQVEVPQIIETVLASANATMDSVDWFLCHQPNRFMLEKLADKMKVPRSKMPSNVVGRFGNSGATTLPIAMAINLTEALKTGTQRACLAGFGVGLTWAAMLMQIGKLDFCDLIDYP
jgi:3-oxoacyl-[acyl-carrier-protein] synthase-3